MSIYPMPSDSKKIKGRLETQAAFHMRKWKISEPVITPVAVYTFDGAVGTGHLLGTSVDAVMLGTVASVAVTMISEPKGRRLVMTYTVTGRLLGGALAPPLAYFLIGETIGSYPFSGEQRLQLAHMFASVVVGLLWQMLLKFARTVWPSSENHADDIVEWLLNLLPWRPKR